MLTLSIHANELNVHLPLSSDLFNLANSAKDSFILSNPLPLSKLHLLALWINFLNVNNYSTDLLRASFAHLINLIKPQNIHIAVQNDDNKDFILKTYYSCSDLVPYVTESALLNGPDTAIFALFGGQGPNEEYLVELQSLFNNYQSYLEELIQLASDELNLDVITWLRTNQHPAIEYTASVPVSLPLIGLTQLCHYYVSCRVLDLTPAQMINHFKGVTGHSQGIISAVAISASTTQESFLENAVKAVKLLASIGSRAQEAFPKLYLEPSIVNDCKESEGFPTAMLSVGGLEKSVLEKHIKTTNACLPGQTIGISLINGATLFIVTGPPKSLYGLIQSLRKIRASPNVDQSKIPFSQRKPNVSMRFLPVDVPFHSDYLSECADQVEKDVGYVELWSPKDLQIGVFHTETGMDLRNLTTSLVRSLCDQILTLPINWLTATTFPVKPTHIIDFGPGGLAGIGSLTAKNLEGQGVTTIVTGKDYSLYDCKKFTTTDSWVKNWSPNNGNVFLDTALSRLTGKPPIWCCGMTPSTVSGDFIVATTNAGYSIELAGGGHYNEKMLREKVNYIKERVEPGHGEGLPIEGLTVAAGIPSLDVANGIIANLKDAGIKYVSFKPGSIDGIRQVVSIAGANPDYPILLQWTGGRAGGHHSYEDFFQPLLQTYGAIRQRMNIVLIVGSGFGSSEDTIPFITGEWSKKYLVSPMPVDGVLFGSRLMVAKECATSLGAKQAIVDAPGVSDEQWEGTYTKETGGIITVKSELGEPIHKIATRGVKLWKEFDDKVFSLPKDKREKWLKENKRYVIDRLNKDFQKPWFAKKKNGDVPDSVDCMTYEEVALRMTELMFVAHQSRWIHVSHRNLVGDFLKRIEERFMTTIGLESLIPDFNLLNKDPFKFLSGFFKAYPFALMQPLTSEDVEFFLALCKRPGSKPVPFVGVIGGDFEVWFKKDSLWQSEDLDSVIDQDVGRVCILQGPVAVRHSKKVNEPIKEILDEVNNGIISHMKSQLIEIPTLESLPVYRATAKQDIKLEDYHIAESENPSIKKFRIFSAANVPTADTWFEVLSQGKVNWLSALLLTNFIVQGKSYVNNPIRRLLKPQAGQTVLIEDTKSGLVLKTPDENVMISYKDGKILVSLSHNGVPLNLFFVYHPERTYAPIHEVMEGRNARINRFYYQLWFAESDMPTDLTTSSIFKSAGILNVDEVKAFCNVINNFCPQYSEGKMAPMDFAIVVGWKPIIQALFAKEIDGDLLKLVHLSNSFRIKSNATHLLVQDKINVEAKVTSVKITPSGKIVKVVGTLVRDSNPLMEVTSEFMFRGAYDDYHNCFDDVKEESMLVTLKEMKDIEVLMAKQWFTWKAPEVLTCGTSLIFRLFSRYEYATSEVYKSVYCKGLVFVNTPDKGDVVVAEVNSELKNVRGNTVMSYLHRFGKLKLNTIPLAQEYSLPISGVLDPTFTTPNSNTLYASVSGDTNPIHVSQYFADYIDLPATITHGMWTSAATRKYVDVIAAGNNPELVRSYSVNFVGMVAPNDTLKVELKHIGMRNGTKVIRVETINQDGVKVLSGTAQVYQEPSAYVFTGQGSQEQGMGMQLYESSECAKAVWDQADKYLQQQYSFSILDIVRNNPRTKTIHFGGLLGQAIRDRYMSMTYDTVDADGNLKSLALFPDITLSSMSYTFASPTGLLFSTQFAQIALVVTEKAAFEDLRAKGLVSEGQSSFAGHSLGEYAALAAVGGFIPVNSLCDIVFYRGLTMQRAVERDSLNRSNYAMCAVNPSRVGPSFTQEALQEVVSSLSNRIKGLCEIVNFNVENQQYVVAGELLALDALANTLNYIKVKKIDLLALAKIMTKEQIIEHLNAVIDECLERSREKAANGFIELERGYATIPLPGIDIPFHSSHIWSGVGPFRTFITRKIDRHHLNVDLLINKYIPNLTAVPFSLEKSYIESIFERTKSPRLQTILTNWGKDDWSTPKGRQHLGYIILVELLAYQFASPVRWIETQDCLFNHFNVTRMIEVGPSPTLTGMATRTLALKYAVTDSAKAISRSIYCVSKNSKEIYYMFEDAVEESVVDSTPAIAAAAEPIVAAPVSTPVPQATVAAVEIPDEPVAALDVLVAIIAQKLKKSASDLPLSKSVKELVGGKSTLQNEILGDVQAEFSSAPEKGEELPLEELGAALSMGHSGQMGKHSTSMVSRLIAQKFPGGFSLSSAKTHLSKTWGFGSGRTDSVLIRGLTEEPAARLNSEAEGKAWLDSVANKYAKEKGISLQQSNQNAAGGSAGGPVMNSEEFDKYKQENFDFVTQQVELYMRYLGEDSRSGHNLLEKEKTRTAEMQSKLDTLDRELGEKFINGIKPVFSVLKARNFDSYWNWVRQDAFEMWFDMIFGRLTEVDREITAKCIAIINRGDPVLLSYIKYYIETAQVQRGETYKVARDFAVLLLKNCEEALNESPKCKDVTFPTAPCTIITETGEIKYSEVNRPNVRKLEAYVKEMAAGSKVTTKVNLDQVHSDVTKLYNMVKQQPQISGASLEAVKSLYDEVKRSLNSGRNECPTARRSSSSFISPQVDNPTLVPENSLPFLHLKRNLTGDWVYSRQLTNVYLDTLTEIATSGSSFENTNALLTGCGRGSIGVEVLKGLLSGGCRVVVTTSSYSRSTVEFYQQIYHVYGARGSKLVVVPFNQASKQDVLSLVDYIYSSSGLGMDLDYVVPFAAISENGREIDSIDDVSELAHRLMLSNTIRIIGAIKNKKVELGVNTRPTQILLPLSPNHGTFGGDGLYAESKIGLEPLFNKWKSESWGQYISLVGAVIGWTRGTGLMNSTNIVAQGVEKYGVRTFSAKEMGFNLLGLMHPILASISSVEPLWADLSGGMLLIPDLNEIMVDLRKKIQLEASIGDAIAKETAIESKVLHGEQASVDVSKIQLRANETYSFPALLDYPQLQEKMKITNQKKTRIGDFSLAGMIDLEKVAVVVGFAEVGPFGSARTRWEMESKGEFSITGCVELARIMGYIKFFSGRLKDGKSYIGWIELESGKPISDSDIKVKYEKVILEHTGIRLIEPELFGGYNPNKKEFLHEVILDHDLEPFETAQEEALQFKLKHGDKCDIWCSTESDGQWFAKLKKGASLLIPKAMKFNRLVAGQIPTGWDAKRYGIPQDIIDQVDPCTLWSLVSTAEALASAGITDPYELFKYVHVSEVGTALGSGLGGVRALRGIFNGRKMGEDIQKDILQESFINTTAGWINLLLLSASGPVKIPVGACATALQSLEIGVDTIVTGKAKVMVCGGFDDFSEEGSAEFANMKATSNSETEFAQGRSPTEMSRPTTSSRAGFMESQGAGVQILMQAKLAIEMGVPIYGIVGLTNTAMDKEGRSVPAPGQGILTTAREVSSPTLSPRLDLNYRRRQLEFRRRQIGEWLSHEHQLVEEEAMRLEDRSKVEQYVKDKLDILKLEAARQESEALNTWGVGFYKNDPSIAPLRGALASFGLDIDDVGVVSFHGTSTKANDKNESDVCNKQFRHLGRSAGNGCPVIAQKWLTGHPKGAAAAWMTNGLIQTMLSGLVPGNRNADNISPELEKFDHIFYPSRSIQTDGIKAGILKSFGFGQVGGEALLIHPEYLLSSLTEKAYAEYQTKNHQRWQSSYRLLHDAMVHENLVKLKDAAPYSDELESSVYLNPTSRATLDPKGEYSFQQPITAKKLNASAANLLDSESISKAKGVGIDTELFTSLALNNPTFVNRNFTRAEIKECLSRPDSVASFTGRWTAKEAVVKSISSFAASTKSNVPTTKGAGAPLIDIEILGNKEGVPEVKLHGDAQRIANKIGISEIKVSISHAEGHAVSIAISQ
ncbi:3-oxoacyl-[acyl-carrier-protein] synthase [Globomyces sp. JEL0801]|nr:3-oxoacyl-[acyl-carrier-protein] synthase [Globomyces sp. JEL0801]